MNHFKAARLKFKFGEPVRKGRKPFLRPQTVSQVFVCVTAPQPTRARMLTRFPFGVCLVINYQACLAAYAFPLGPTNPALIDIVLEPFLASGLWDRTKEFATDTKICTRGCSEAGYPAFFVASPTPSYTFGLRYI